MPLIYNYTQGQALLTHAEVAALSHDPRGAQAQIASAVETAHTQTIAADQLDAADVARARAYADIAGEDRQAATADTQAYVDDLKNDVGYGVGFDNLAALTQAMPLLAYAQAQRGDFAKALVSINATPRDCYTCVLVRGQITTLQKDWNGAATWFADAVKQAPSIPFAYGEWGAMLMTKGDLDGAIAKFTLANQKGPHFADPLEMWGEALIAKNRSDLALAKFDEANKYAPHWGRLHLKWGEALLWSGDKDSAQKQFAIARELDLTLSETSELAKISHV